MNLEKYSLTPILISAILLLIVAWQIATIQEGHTWGDDFSLYILQAKNLVEGHPYAETGYIVNPHTTVGIGPQTYPPALSIFLSPIYKYLGLNFFAMKIEMIFFLIMSLLASYLLFKDKLSPNSLISLILILGFNIYLCQIKNSILSDLPFLFLALQSLFFLEKLQTTSSKNIQKVYLLLSALFIFMSIETRSIGWALIITMLISNAFNKGKYLLSHLTIIIIVVSLVLFQHILLPIPNDYAEHFKLDPLLFLHNVLSYMKSLGLLWKNGYSRILNLLLFMLLTGFAIRGYWIRLQKQITYLEIFPIIYMGVICLWPVRQGIRFLIPIIPIYIFYMLKGMESFNNIRIKKIIFLFSSISILITYIACFTTCNFGPIPEGLGKKETIELFTYVKQNTNKDDVFVFFKPRALALMTERKASGFHEPKNPSELFVYFEQISADYIILGPEKNEYLDKFSDDFKEHLQLVYNNSDFRVFKILSYPAIVQDNVAN